MRNRVDWRDARVAEIRQVAEDVRYIGFAVDGAVPRFDPGSHSNIWVEIGGVPAVHPRDDAVHDLELGNRIVGPVGSDEPELWERRHELLAVQLPPVA